MSDIEIATWMLRLYDESAWPLFDHVEKPAADEGVCWGLKKFGTNSQLVVLRGSVTREDYFRDFFALPATELLGLGPVHAGFALGMIDAWEKIKAMSPGPLLITGHSLGAARAWILAGMAILDRRPPIDVVVFGSPRPGFAPLAALCGRVPTRSYRNRHDPVCEVPFTFYPEFAYVQPIAFTALDVKPAPDDPWGPFADHHMELYAAGLKNA